MSRKFAIGALIGAVAGVVAGVLTAPKSGKETRADLKQKAVELKEKTGDKADEAKTKASKTAEDVRAAAEDLRNRSGQAVDGAIEGAEIEREERATALAPLGSLLPGSAFLGSMCAGQSGYRNPTTLSASASRGAKRSVW